jgi:hypothetical protein
MTAPSPASPCVPGRPEGTATGQRCFGQSRGVSLELRPFGLTAGACHGALPQPEGGWQPRLSPVIPFPQRAPRFELFPLGKKRVFVRISLVCESGWLRDSPRNPIEHATSRAAGGRRVTRSVRGATGSQPGDSGNHEDRLWGSMFREMQPLHAGSGSCAWSSTIRGNRHPMFCLPQRTR